MHKRRLGAGSAGRFEEVECASGIGIEIIEWNCCRPVMGWLGSGVHNHVWPDIRNEPEDGRPIANIQVEVAVIRYCALEPRERPAGIALRPEEDAALVVIDAET